MASPRTHAKKVARARQVRKKLKVYDRLVRDYAKKSKKSYQAARSDPTFKLIYKALNLKYVEQITPRQKREYIAAHPGFVFDAKGRQAYLKQRRAAIPKIKAQALYRLGRVDKEEIVKYVEKFNSEGV